MHTQTFAASSGLRGIMRFTGHARGRCPLVVASVLIMSCGFVESGSAATGLPPGFQDVPVVSGLSAPTAMDFAPDGRLFVTEKGGTLRVIKNGVLLSTPFLTLTVDQNGERGLLGIAFDPNFASNQYLYVYYTATTPAAHNRISRFTANGDVQVPGSEVVLLDFGNLSAATNHNGGGLHFGPDGKLYAAHGENANGANSQTLNNLLGKIIRMNPVSDPTAQIPTDNPFYMAATGKNRLIWLWGLRNPFTFAFQPGTGRAFVNDVGNATWEEINDGIAGHNYGWPTTEGAFNPLTYPEFTNPLYVYPHSGTPPACAITGGAFYNPSASTFPASYIGKYFFSDLCSGWIYYIDPASPATATSFAAGISGPVDLKVGPDSALYYLAINSGTVGKIVMPSGPQITQQPANRTVVPVGGTATFTVSVAGTPTPSYQWQKNGVDIPGAMSASYTTPPVTMADHNSTYRCRVTNSTGTATSNSGMLTISRDFDGDGKADVTVYRPSNGTWFILQSSANSMSWIVYQWGLSGDVPVPGDYDGDGKTDMAVYRPSTGYWYLLKSSTNFATWTVYQWGISADVPVPGDYDGDGKTDMAVYRPSTGYWYLLKSSTNFATWTVYQWGISGDMPVPGDYDGDGKNDMAVYRPSTGYWYLLNSSTNFASWTVYQWGISGDMPEPGDYDGDGKTDMAVYRPSTGYWYLLKSSTNFASWIVDQWGISGDVPTPGDYDGDGKTDMAVYRPSTGYWYLLKSSTNYTTWTISQWGVSGDIPVVLR